MKDTPTDHVPALQAPGRLRLRAQALLQSNAFDNLIMTLIVLSVASVGVEAIPGLPEWAVSALRLGEIVVVAIFSLEYLLRILVAREKVRFILSFQGLVDLLSIAPFYLVGADARWLRTLRLLRLL